MVPYRERKSSEFRKESLKARGVLAEEGGGGFGRHDGDCMRKCVGDRSERINLGSVKASGRVLQPTAAWMISAVLREMET